MVYFMVYCILHGILHGILVYLMVYCILHGIHSQTQKRSHCDIALLMYIIIDFFLSMFME